MKIDLAPNILLFSFQNNMKQLLITIVALVLVGCGPSVDIHQAAERGNIEIVKQAIADGADVNAKTEDGWTPLHFATSGGYEEITELLIAKGADVNARDNRGGTSLLEAALSGKKEIAKILIAKGTNVNAKDDIGRTTLHAAAWHGQKEVAELLIVEGADVHVKDKEGSTPLHRVADRMMMQLVVDNDANANAKKQIVEQLITNNANVNARDNRGDTPLHRAALGGYTKIAELLIDNGANVNTKKEDGQTPLHEAALNGNKKIIELLIARAADVNAKNMNGNTPLNYSEGKWETDSSELEAVRKEIADLLRKHGGKTGEELKAEGNLAKPDAEAKKPEPPTAKASDISIHQAAKKGDIEAIKQHFAAGTDVDEKYGDLTPLHFAAVHGRKEVVELLIATGADVNAKLEKGMFKGMTPLDRAVQFNEPETADLLRKHGGKTGEELKAEGK